MQQGPDPDTHAYPTMISTLLPGSRQASSEQTRPNRLVRLGTWVFLAIVALLQCYSSVYFSGQKVDESEVVAYAVGFLGGDLNPHWFGYGSFPLYALSLVYLVIWTGGHLIGWFGPLDEYAAQLVHDEAFFYIIARYLFALVGVVTLWLYARSLRCLGAPSVLAGAYFFLAATHPSAIGYANFIKIDHLVGLFFAIAVHALVSAPRAPRTLLVVASVSALALTTKVSAAPILALLFLAALCNYDSHRSWRNIVVAVCLFFLLVFVTQPFSNPVSAILAALRSHAGDQLLTLVRPHYDNMGDRVLALNALLVGYLTSLHFSVALLLPFGLVREVRKGFLSLFLVAALIISPFLIASDIQPYWMVPIYPILLALVFLGLWGLIQFVGRRSKSAGIGVLAVGVCGSLLQAGLSSQAVLKHWIEPAGVSNRELAADWLEAYALGSDVVVLERSHSNLMPEVHDLSSLARSREATRLFIFNRRENVFLTGLFDSFLVDHYPRELARLEAFPPRMTHSIAVTIRIRGRGALVLTPPRICDSADRCAALELAGAVNVTAVPRGDRIELSPTAPSQELRFVRKEPLLLDGTSRLEFDMEGDHAGPGSVAIGFDGQFREGELLHIPSPGSFSAPLFQFGEFPWLINLREPAQLTNAAIRPDRRVLMVTSPAIYNRYRGLDPARFEGGNRDRVVQRQSFYRSLLGSTPLVKRVSEGAGAPIEIYDISDLVFARLPKGDSSVQSPSLIWFTPAALSRCAVDETVMVHWDASSVPDVRTVHVRTVRPNGQEGEFAAAGPIGSKPTGPWMSAGRQLILRNADDGRELGRATLGGTACSQPGESRGNQ